MRFNFMYIEDQFLTVTVKKAGSKGDNIIVLDIPAFL